MSITEFSLTPNQTLGHYRSQNPNSENTNATLLHNGERINIIRPTGSKLNLEMDRSITQEIKCLTAVLAIVVSAGLAFHSNTIKSWLDIDRKIIAHKVYCAETGQSDFVIVGKLNKRSSIKTLAKTMGIVLTMFCAIGLLRNSCK